MFEKGYYLCDRHWTKLQNAGHMQLTWSLQVKMHFCTLYVGGRTLVPGQKACTWQYQVLVFDTDLLSFYLLCLKRCYPSDTHSAHVKLSFQRLMWCYPIHLTRTLKMLQNAMKQLAVLVRMYVQRYYLRRCYPSDADWAHVWTCSQLWQMSVCCCTGCTLPAPFSTKDKCKDKQRQIQR